MGYDFEFIETLYCGDLYRIKGLHKTIGRIAPEIEETNLIDTVVLFSHHINQYTARNKRLKAKTLFEILKNYW